MREYLATVKDMVKVKKNVILPEIPACFKVPVKQNFLFFITKEHKRIERLPFTISQYLIWFQSYKTLKMLFKIKAKSTDTKHAILVMSHTLNKYSLDS